MGGAMGIQKGKPGLAVQLGDLLFRVIEQGALFEPAVELGYPGGVLRRQLLQGAQGAPGLAPWGITPPAANEPGEQGQGEQRQRQ